AMRYGTRKAPPPPSYATYGKRQMLPSPTAEPMAAKMKTLRVENPSRVVALWALVVDMPVLLTRCDPKHGPSGQKVVGNSRCRVTPVMSVPAGAGGPPVPVEVRRLPAADASKPPGGGSAALRRVRHLADELLDDVLEEDDTEDDAGVADDPGDVGAGALHGLEHVLDLVVGKDGRHAAEALARHGKGAVLPFGVEHVLEVEVAGELAR